MSDVMLHGVLRMPPELWRTDRIDVAQRHARYVEASDRIRDLEEVLERIVCMYTHAWDRTDGGLQIFPESVNKFDAAFNRAHFLIGRPLHDENGNPVGTKRLDAAMSGEGKDG